jgi:WD40 repeat protein
MISQLAKITLKNVEQLQVVGTLAGHTGPILSIDVAPDGRRLASGSMDGTARIWNLLTSKQESVLAANPEEEQVPRLAFSPTNPDHLAVAVKRKPSWAIAEVREYVGNLMKDIFSFSKGTPVWRVWSLEKAAIIHTEEMLHTILGTTGLTYSRDGHWLAVGDGVFDATTEPYARAVRLTQDRVQDMAFSNDGQLVAVVSFYEKMPESIMYHTVEIFQSDGWHRIAVIKETWRMSQFSDVCFLPGGHELLVRTSLENVRGGGAHKLYRFPEDDYAKGSRVLNNVACFACHPDAILVAVAKYDGRMVLLDWDQQKTVVAVQAYTPARPVKRPRGIMTRDKLNQVNDAAKSQYRATQDMVFSPDGKLLISADGDQVIRLWGIRA